MPQTLLGLLGLTLVTMLSINQQRVTTQGYQNRLHEEYDLAASGVMMHVMEMIASRSFDEYTTPDKLDANNRSAYDMKGNDFTHRWGFGAAGREGDGCDLERPANTPGCDDVDDLDGIRNQVVYARLRGEKTLPFEVSIDVFYVDDDDLETPVAHRTKNKRVVLWAESPLRPGVELVRLERVISYDPVKADADFETAGYFIDD
jgi:hypothetical protein